MTQPHKSTWLMNKELNPVCLLSLTVLQTPSQHPLVLPHFFSLPPQLPPWPSCPPYQASQAMIAYLFGWYQLFPEKLDVCVSDGRPVGAHCYSQVVLSNVHSGLLQGPNALWHVSDELRWFLSNSHEPLQHRSDDGARHGDFSNGAKGFPSY